ncbi:hypothetical protein HGRIS_012571 [Hohenbuehelia grisea]|uniref:Uncharacterized protein n=1 Tax=Hohenbuehelia grisea TaxID=104357 RepID=A0ABR3ISS7_9AGAR
MECRAAFCSVHFMDSFIFIIYPRHHHFFPCSFASSFFFLITSVSPHPPSHFHSASSLRSCTYNLHSRVPHIAMARAYIWYSLWISFQDSTFFSSFCIATSSSLLLFRSSLIHAACPHSCVIHSSRLSLPYRTSYPLHKLTLNCPSNSRNPKYHYPSCHYPVNRVPVSVFVCVFASPTRTFHCRNFACNTMAFLSLVSGPSPSIYPCLASRVQCVLWPTPAAQLHVYTLILDYYYQLLCWGRTIGPCILAFGMDPGPPPSPTLETIHTDCARIGI